MKKGQDKKHNQTKWVKCGVTKNECKEKTVYLGRPHVQNKCTVYHDVIKVRYSAGKVYNKIDNVYFI